MLQTEHEARNKICPYRKISCVASDCMAWESIGEKGFCARLEQEPNIWASIQRAHNKKAICLDRLIRRKP